MPRDRTTRLLDEFSAVTDAAPRPASPAERIVMQHRFPVATLSAASLVIVAVAVAAVVLARPGPAPVAGSSPAASAASAASAVAGPSESAASAASIAPSRPTTGPCDVTVLAARIVLWEGAAGQRIATVRLTNNGPVACLVDDLARPQLVGGDGAILIDGTAAVPTKHLLVEPGGTLNTLVAAGNDCKPAPVAPVSVAFVFADGRRLVADPASPTDATVPPCNGAGQPATISMHPWAP